MEDPTEKSNRNISFSNESKTNMLLICREAIKNQLIGINNKISSEFDHSEMNLGLFVTLKMKGELRGCIGNVLPNEPLNILLPKMAIASAIHDNRFQPVRIEELEKIQIQISILSPFLEVRDKSEIMLGKDGLMLEYQGRRGLFLPEVATEQNWNLHTFLEQLCYKTGFAPEILDEKPKLSKFSSIKIEEKTY